MTYYKSLVLIIYHYVLVSDGVGLYLDGNQLANYSIVNLKDIGEGECALICYTNSPGCCVIPRAGEWYFPNGSAVSIEGDMKDFYGFRDSMVVRLNRRYNVVSPTGLYCCDIPGSNGNLCVGAYNLGDSKATINFKSLLDNPWPLIIFTSQVSKLISLWKAIC